MQVIPLWKTRMTACIFPWLFCSRQFLRFSTFPWMYLLAGILKSAETAFITYVCINLFISVNTILSTSILYFLGQIASHNVEVCINSLYPNAAVIISTSINPNISNYSLNHLLNMYLLNHFKYVWPEFTGLVSPVCSPNNLSPAWFSDFFPVQFNTVSPFIKTAALKLRLQQSQKKMATILQPSCYT